MKRFSLRFKLWIALMASTIFVSALLGAIAIYRLYYELDEQFIKRGKSFADHIAQEAVQALKRADHTDIQAMLAGLLSSDLVYVQIVYQSNILGEERSIDRNLPVEQQPASLLLCRTQLSNEYGLLDLFRPFALEGESQSQGYVRLGLMLTYVSEEIQMEAKIIGAASLGVLLLGTILALWLHRKLVQPIGALSHSVRSFGAGALQTRAQIHTKDELQDLSEDFNKMADSIVRMQEELRQSNKAKSEFLTVMGHELRTPLNALMGYTELLLEEVDGRLPASQKKHLRAAQRSGQHMSELIENMLRFSKLEMGAETLRLQKVDCKQIVEEAFQGVSAAAQEKKIELRFSRRTPLPWVADAMKLRQILLNLLDNAIKYSERGPIDVRVKQSKQEVVFTVKDHGSGIAKKDLEKIFEPFTQLSKSVTRESKGIGLGLAIVKRYVEMHGGKIWVESAVEKGSVFSCAIPALSLQEAKEPP
ncbi:HAMP domain-containing histidine kinase [Candidatus Acetothermia bacterium]|nr:HAMP domain-containing histidine kinase [Candidatus Acetothermia bacterium]